MYYTRAYLVLIYVLLSGVQTQDCETHYNVSPAPENKECFTSVNGTEEVLSSCTYTCDHKPVINTTVDVENGTVIVRFPLPPMNCGHTEYKVHLFVNEDAAELECNEDKDSFPGKHSTKEYRINRCEEKNCEGKRCTEYGEVVFNHVFSGCYKLRVETFLGTSTRAPLVSCPFYISTNVSKLRIADIQPIVHVDCNQEENVCSVDVKYHQAISKTAIELLFSENGSRVHWAEVLMKEGIEKNRILCRPGSNPMAPSCYYTELHKKIHCKFYDMAPGNYCVRIKLTDDRCDHGTIWTDGSTNCRWSHPFVYTYHPPDQGVITLPVASTLTVFLIFLGVAIGGILVFLLFWRRTPQNTNWSPESSEDVDRPMIEGLKVLLLYPRDCQEFMNVMKSFRKFLETYNIEVFDCHATEEVLNSPLCWIQNVMTYPKLRTVIVSSHCAYLQQQAIQTGCSTPAEIIYKDPVFIDSIFMYGLKIIMEDISADTYLKNYVVGFSGFSSDQKILSLPTSFRRYCIPEHLPKLLMDLNLEQSVENISSISSSECTEFQNDLDVLVNYVKTNPHYLEDLIHLV
ncbi:uncharacterized protein LOC124157746 isoform X2 [Ischnura elegans]|uniref:uncharacterized protein LOC124157746 isoform X2 n=1 Tax=Ischnura elegans TaxID=197161 RepID=UPI001ED86A4A|nr:uncharacterized protein LOC124157746 isoform X2 [Ischnura elegans]